MKNKRGNEYRTELKELKNKFINKVIKLQSNISKELENAPDDDNLNNIMLRLGYDEANATIKAIETLNKSNLELYFINLLTDNQLDVFNLIVRGYTNKQVAEKLIISEKTVRYHLNEILIKISNDKLLADIISNSCNFNDFIVGYDLLKNPLLKSPTKFLKSFYKRLKD